MLKPRYQGVAAAAVALAMLGAACAGSDKAGVESGSPKTPLEAGSPSPDPAAPVSPTPESVPDAAAPAAPDASAGAAAATPGASTGAAPAAPTPKPGAAPTAPGSTGTKAPVASSPKPGAPAPGSAASPATPGKPAPAPGSPAPAPGGRTASDVGVTPDSIKLGSISGVNTPLGNIVAAPVTTAVIAAARATNDAGGIHGRKMDVIDCDDAGDVTRFRACFRKLVEQDKIFSFITSITWGTGEVHGDLARAKIPWVGSWGFYTSEWKDQWMFPVHMASVHEAHANAMWVRDVIKPKTVGVLFLNSPEQQVAKKALHEVLDPAGIKVVKEIPQEIDTPDESGNVLSMRAAEPDHIIHLSWPPPIVKFMYDAEKQGYWPKKGVSGNHFLGEIIGDLVGSWPLQGMWTISTYQIWGAEYYATMEKYAPQMRKRNHHITQSGFIGTKIFADAARAVGPELTRDKLMKVLESRKWDMGPGLGQSVLWSPGNHDTMRCEYMFKYNSTEVGSNKVYVPAPEKFEICDDLD